MKTLGYVIMFLSFGLGVSMCWLASERWNSGVYWLAILYVALGAFNFWNTNRMYNTLKSYKEQVNG